MLAPLFAGGAAGFAVDVALFPLDTIKTRMQSHEGFLKSGGFKGVYKGLGPAALGSFPGAACFFFSYELLKDHQFSHLFSACLSECVACLVRVPTENLKQNLQTNRFSTLSSAARHLAQSRGFYNGYLTTIMREIPFSAIQFPMWEGGKRMIADFQGSSASSLQSAVWGSLSGGVAAALTTPIDVIKTRLMTSPQKYSQGMVSAFRTVYREEGVAAFFLGIKPRVVWISIGGFVFLGTYEASLKVLS